MPEPQDGKVTIQCSASVSVPDDAHSHVPVLLSVPILVKFASIMHNFAKLACKIVLELTKYLGSMQNLN